VAVQQIKQRGLTVTPVLSGCAKKRLALLGGNLSNLAISLGRLAKIQVAYLHPANVG